MAGHRVAEGTQVHHGGVTYTSGDKLPADADRETVDRWVAAGWVVEVTTSRKAAPSASKRP